MLRGKCLVLGDPCVGKSALAHAWSTDGASFPQEYVMTTSTDYVVKVVDVAGVEGGVELHVHASAGRPEFASVAEQLWSEPSAVVLCFDVTNEASFASLPRWLQKYRALKPGHPVRGVLVATKTDLEGQRAVSAEAADEFAAQNDLAFVEVSAKEGRNVNEPFRVLAESLQKHYKETIDAMIAASS